MMCCGWDGSVWTEIQSFSGIICDGTNQLHTISPVSLSLFTKFRFICTAIDWNNNPGLNYAYMANMTIVIGVPQAMQSARKASMQNNVKGVARKKKPLSKNGLSLVNQMNVHEYDFGEEIQLAMDAKEMPDTSLLTENNTAVNWKSVAACLVDSVQRLTKRVHELEKN